MARGRGGGGVPEHNSKLGKGKAKAGKCKAISCDFRIYPAPLPPLVLVGEASPVVSRRGPHDQRGCSATTPGPSLVGPQGREALCVPWGPSNFLSRTQAVGVCDLAFKAVPPVPPGSQKAQLPPGHPQRRRCPCAHAVVGWPGSMSL